MTAGIRVTAQCKRCGRWSEAPDREMYVTVTLSAASLTPEAFAQCVNAQLCDAEAARVRGV